MQEHRQRLVDIWGTDTSNSGTALRWIQLAVQRGAEETLYLDFKQKSDAKSGVPGDDDKANLAKAISGFANTDGGLVIWGVKAKPASKDDPDVATQLAPISGLKTFLSRINALSGEVVNPPVAGVESRPIPLPDRSDEGFVITVIPKKRETAACSAPSPNRVGRSVLSGGGTCLQTVCGISCRPSEVIVERCCSP